MDNRTMKSIVEVPGYTLTEVEEYSPQLVVWKGYLDSDRNRRQLVLKRLRLNPTDAALARSEFHRVQHLQSGSLLKVYDIIDSPEGLILVLEDPNGVPLSLFQKNQTLDVETALKITIQLADALKDLHRHDLLHRNVRPSSILIDPQKCTVKLGGFGVFSVTKGGAQSSADMLRERLAYGSPEQTGRMNRSVDYRTDFYSLGVTLYEMLTGRVPFESTDPLELLHSHIAKKPVHPTEVNPGIPRILGDIVMRLLAKNAEDRYQTGNGLETDLITCLRQWQTVGYIQSFALGANDISDRFRIPQKLYGREREIEILTRAFERVCQGENELMLVAGRPGIGKSVLVREVHKPIVARRGYFIFGKYEQLRRDEPYSAILQAFRELVRQILSESEERIKIWRDTLLVTLGPNGKVITDVIPNVELIIGRQPEIPKLGPEESRNRFNIVFERFVGVFSKGDHPIVLFLDDLQWADLASLEMIRKMIESPETSHLLILGAYRDNEVSDTHPLIDTLKEIQKKGINVNTITIGPLLLQDVDNLILDSLKCSEERGAELGGLVCKKTGGNPFFVNQFLKTLYDEGVITLDQQEGWQWDTEKIRGMQVTDNLVELLVEKINRLPEGTREALKVCACIGNRFDLETVAHLMEKSLDESLQDLAEAVKEGLVEVSHDMYFYHHDRIQEAAYSLLPKEEKEKLHYRIGNLALERTDATELKDKLFYIVDQLNSGSECIIGEKEKQELARLNLEAGRKAKASAAYSPSMVYLNMGLGFLHEDCWESQYDFTLEIHNEATEAAFLKGDYGQMEALADTIIKHARNTVDTTEVLCTKISACKAQHNLDEALDIGVDAVRSLGVDFPRNPEMGAIIEELGKVMQRLAAKTDEELIDLPDMTDHEMLSVSHIFESLATVAYFASPNVFALLVLQSINRYLTHGNTLWTPYGFVGYGTILNVGLGDIEGGYRFGNLALQMMDKWDVKEIKPAIISAYGFLLCHWKEHPRRSVALGLEGYQLGIETGRLEDAALNLVLHDAYSLLIDTPLAQLEQDMAKHHRIIEQLNQKHVLHNHANWWQFVLNLLGQSDDPTVLIGKAFDEVKAEREFLEANNLTYLCTIYYAKLHLLYLFEKYSQSLAYLEKIEKYSEGMKGLNSAILVNYLGSLIRLASWSEVSKEEKGQLLQKVSENQATLKRWVDITPGNFLHRFNMVEAERARVMGDVGLAVVSYEKAIELAEKSECLMDQALANELAAKFYLSRGNEKIASVYMCEAHSCYSRWNANAKVKQLEETYSQLLSSRQKPLDATTTPCTSLATSDRFDLSSIMKAAQTISGEMVLGKLLSNIMRIVIENAGAQRGLLILEKEERLFVEAEGSVDQAKIAVDRLRSVPVETRTDLPHGIINYVKRTMVDLVLGDAGQEGPFTLDPYVQAHQSKSILCTPIVKQNKLIGLLYLENNLSANVFTPERLVLLSLLSSQAAISLENAQVYDELELRVQNRTAELSQANATLKEMMVERKRAEKELQERERKFRQLFTNVSDVVVFVDPSGRLFDVNNRVEGVFGYSREEVLGRNFAEVPIFSPETLSTVTSQLASAVGTESAMPVLSVPAVHKDGHEVHIDISTAVLKGSQGELQGSVSTIRDVSERTRMETELVMRAEELAVLNESLEQRVRERTVDVEKLLKHKDDFIRQLGHDLRSPLTPLVALLPMLKDDLDESERQEIVDVAMTNVNFISELVNKTLKLASITSLQSSTVTGRANLRNGLEVVLRGKRPVAESKNISLETSVEDDVVVQLGQSDLQEIFDNLISNAIKFTAEGGRIAVDAVISDPYVAVSVRDTGIGMTPEQLSHVCDEFYKADPSRHELDSSGLGLTICKRIVEQHGGRIWAESEGLGKGSVFCFTLPLSSAVTSVEVGANG